MSRITTLFKSNRSQALRLPKDVAFPETVRQVEITVVGNTRVITPAGSGWSEWFAHGERVTDDFLAERDQPPMQERDLTW